MNGNCTELPFIPHSDFRNPHWGEVEGGGRAPVVAPPRGAR